METLLNSVTPPPVDIITGGFPCQNISIAGNFDGIVGKESRLWHEYLRIIHEVGPRYIVIENSVQLANKGLEYILYDLSKAGYDAQWQNLSASQFGYPHKRERLFIVAYSIKNRRHQKWPVPMFQEITGILKRPYRQVVLPVPVKRFKWSSNHDDIRGYNGVPFKLDRRRIAATGDAVVPEIIEYIMNCIKQFDAISYINPLAA